MKKKAKRRTPKLSERLKKNKYPFITHADPLTGGSPYPTHTHGLTKIGWPEFLMDPLSFGPHGNAGKINTAYDYLLRLDLVEPASLIIIEKAKRRQKRGLRLAA